MKCVTKLALALAGTAVVVSAAGVAVATTTSSDTVTLCVNTQSNRSVSVPGSSGVCAKGQQTIKVASDTAVANLQSQIDALSTKVADDKAVIDTLSDQAADNQRIIDALHDKFAGTLSVTIDAVTLGGFLVHVTGSGLEPGTDVLIFEGTQEFGRWTVGSDGTIDKSAPNGCLSDSRVHAEGTNVFIEAVSSATIDPCA